MLGRVGWVDKALNAFRISTAGEETREEAMAELRDVLDGVVKDFTAYGARLLGVVKRPRQLLFRAGGIFGEDSRRRRRRGNAFAAHEPW
ncbi:hypothetical protein [Mesorhizobium australicum]|uniref:hypothetical protein n=1 Tax=Mesorhizobium australicum TaxID=536018 RepID=UPI00333CD09E